MAKKTRKVNPEHRQCRIIGHTWKYANAKRVGRYWEQGLRCSECKTERFIEIDARTGEVSGSRYKYPEGYLLEEGGALTPQERASLRLIEIKSHTRSA